MGLKQLWPTVIAEETAVARGRQISDLRRQSGNLRRLPWTGQLSRRRRMAQLDPKRTLSPAGANRPDAPKQSLPAGAGNGRA